MHYAHICEGAGDIQLEVQTSNFASNHPVFPDPFPLLGSAARVSEAGRGEAHDRGSYDCFVFVSASFLVSLF